MKKCPYCEEWIQDDAIKCRFCKERLDTVKNVSRRHIGKVCPKCKQRYEDGSGVCRRCNIRLSDMEEEILPSASTIDRQIVRTIAVDEKGNQTILSEVEQRTDVKPGGYPETKHTQTITHHGCGCPATPNNYGGKCPRCKKTFCNEVWNGVPIHYILCAVCHTKVCSRHAKFNKPVFCSVWCMVRYWFHTRDWNGVSKDMSYFIGDYLPRFILAFIMVFITFILLLYCAACYFR